jgi:hypothetical protein
MKVKVMSEHGYGESMIGLSLSYASTPERARVIAPGLAHKGGGHSKFLETMIIWLDVEFPRFVWSEADTYRLSTKQSASTMHTIAKGKLSQENFEYPIWQLTLERLNALIEYHSTADPVEKKAVFLKIKNELPEGFLQRRIWCFSYKTLQGMYSQRINHKLPQWKIFLETVLSEIEHPEFIVKPKEIIAP